MLNSLKYYILIFRFMLFSVMFLLLFTACNEAVLPTLVPTTMPLPLIEPLSLTRPPTPLVMPSVSVLAGQAPPLPTRLIPATMTPWPTATAVSTIRLGAAAAVPLELVRLAQQLAEQQPDRFTWVADGPADLTLTVNEGALLAQWVYAVATPFATVTDDVAYTDLMAAWQSGLPAAGSIYMERETAALLESLWGSPTAAVTIVAPDELVGALWQARPSWTLIPFDQLTPDLKVLRLDGHSPLAPDFDAANYPLVVSIGIRGDAAAVAQFRALWSGPVTNRDPARLTRVAMTGVTALSRAVAYQMELNGVTYPGEVVADVLQAADIAHISHEAPFAPDCPYPNPVGGTTFCARDHYLDLLKSIGTTVVELTGNHVNDWGAHNLSHTIDLYEAAGMAYFGGGRNLVDAAQPALFEHNGNRIAFVGCNPVGPTYAWATAHSAGSRPCHYDALFSEIEGLDRDGYLVIATLQYWEFYHYAPTAQQKIDFRRVAEAGAATVSGSQAHHAQSFDFHEGAFIHYGLGNLFFDQMDMLGTRQSFIDGYVVYDGRLLSVDLWTGLIENWSRPRLMTAAEREQLLRTVFQASGW